MNNQLSLEFGKPFLRIPLQTSPTIKCADALEFDWSELLPPEECSFVFGNPPFVGAKYQSPFQRTQVRRVAGLGGSGGTLDYVAAWFILAGKYIKEGTARIGFVATNSITQGEQVAQLWPLLLHHQELEIAFAHRAFAWGSDAPGTASVHVVIVGLDKQELALSTKRLYSYASANKDPEESKHKFLSPYLFGVESEMRTALVVEKQSTPINGLRRLVIGSKPIDGGNFILNLNARRELLDSEPEAARFVRPFVGANEFLNDDRRWIISLHDATPDQMKSMPQILKKIAAVRKFRMESNSMPTRKLADTPTVYHVNVIPENSFLVIPKVGTERREYVPIGWLDPPAIPSDLLFVLDNASYAEFALLTSAMHMAWLRTIGGRLGSALRYSIGLVYNTFPTPPRFPDCMRRRSFERAVASVLTVRNEFSRSSLAALYNPDLMPLKLRRAHQALDKEVEKLYRRSGFESDHDRFEHLFSLYQEMKTPVLAATRRRKRRSKAKPAE